jgi:predicted DNA-binding transcriptional regulator YafY
MSHDTDKLIRQLSLVAFLMAERRPLTARDVQQNVEGYSEMSDEAFARRFYSDRAELQALGVPLHSQRDEYTGEELYTLRSENYFLPPLELTDEELAALQTSLYLLEGTFAYAEPLRLALQNLALGRPGFAATPSPAAARVQVRDPDYSPEMPGRLSKLEGAISRQRTVRFPYYSIGRDDLRERTINPYALLPENGVWYVVGDDLEDGRRKKFRVSRIRGEIRFATRRERDFRVPADFSIDEHLGKPAWQLGEPLGEARVEVAPETAWWVERVHGGAGRLEDGVFVTEYSNVDQLVAWILRQEGRAIPLEPDELREATLDALRRVRERHEGEPPGVAAELAAPEREAVGERPAGPVAPERFGLLQALLAFLLDRCGEERAAEIPAKELVERFHIPRESLQEHLSLLNLVNFGGGCYTVYAELKGNVVRVDKELFGDTFRASPRLTPLEARAIRLALEFVGPMITAGSRTPLEKVRNKLEETFGQFELAQTPEPHVGEPEEELLRTLSRAMADQLVVEIEYLKEDEERPTTRLVEPYEFIRELPVWRVHTFDRTKEQPRTYRLDRMRAARLTKEHFEPRPDFDPNYLSGATIATVWYSSEIARFKVERGAHPLADGAAVAELPVGSPEWLVGEIFADRGEAVVLEPPDLRELVEERAGALVEQLEAAPLRT